MVLTSDAKLDCNLSVQAYLKLRNRDVVLRTRDQGIWDEEISNNPPPYAVANLLHLRIRIESSTKTVPNQCHWIFGQVGYEQVHVVECAWGDLVGKKPCKE